MTVPRLVLLFLSARVAAVVAARSQWMWIATKDTFRAKFDEKDVDSIEETRPPHKTKILRISKISFVGACTKY